MNEGAEGDGGFGHYRTSIAALVHDLNHKLGLSSRTRTYLHVWQKVSLYANPTF